MLYINKYGTIKPVAHLLTVSVLHENKTSTDLLLDSVEALLKIVKEIGSSKKTANIVKAALEQHGPKSAVSIS